MADTALHRIFNACVNSGDFSNAYLCYGFHHPTLTKSLLPFIEAYFKQREPDFELNDDQLEHCADLRVYAYSQTIKIDDIRSIKEQVKYGANRFQRLFVIIDDAAHMTSEAANAFLKVCEEPLESVTFILCTNHLNRILPTIQSRCQHIFCSSDTASFFNDDSLVSFQSFQAMDVLARMAFCTELAADKEQTKKQLESWIHDLSECPQLDFVAMEHIFKTLQRLQFNVNLRMQLESLSFELISS